MVIYYSTTTHSSSIKAAPQTGFTLIELMIVVAIIGILAAIVYPSYQGYVERTNRADMMSEMQQIATRIESSKTNYKRYDRIPLSSVLSGTPATDGSVNFPSSGTALYIVTVTPNDATTLTSKDWTVTAAPITGTRMAGDGSLTLDSTGEKCRGTYCGSGSEWQ
ncbi:type IV pilin protein [Psychrobacter sp. T6-1]|uniref:type IV pilin protein n=1 Tax=Psychrobacter sp. T6-1 TaxID=3457447 RepID=UPI003FD60C3A